MIQPLRRAGNDSTQSSFQLSLLAVTVTVVASLTTGCATDSPEDRVIERVKAEHAGEDWMDHVIDWDGGGLADFSPDTDYRINDEMSYAPAVAICEAIRTTIAVGADEPLIRVFGVKTDKRTEVDGSVAPETEAEMIAQFAPPMSDTCGATPPYDLKEEVEAAGVNLY